MAERRGLLGRLGLGGARPDDAAAWQEAGAAVTVADAAAATRLAQEAATPFGYRRPARELLAAFGGTGEEERRRATAALTLAGVAADPPLSAAEPHQYVQLRRIEASSAPAAADPAPAAAPPSARPVFKTSAGGTPVQKVAARFAPRTPVTRDRRIAAGALGFGALAVVMILAVTLRGGVGVGDDSVANSLPPAPETTETTAATTRTAPSPPPAGGRGGAARAGGAAPAAEAPRPRLVRLRVVPSEEMYVCIGDGAGATLWEGMLTGPYEARRARLIVRVGVATARITANGRPVRVTTAPGAFELTPTAIRELPGDQLVCGAATTAPPAGDGDTALPDAG